MNNTIDRLVSGKVYPRRVVGVNPAAVGVCLWVGVTLPVLVGLPLAGGLGCTQHRAELTTPPGSAFYPVGIWYGVESIPSLRHEQQGRRLDADLATISRMGLNAVWFRHIDPDAFAAATATAHRHHLKVVLPDRQAQHYVMMGDSGPPTAPASWLRNDDSSVIRSLWAVDLGRATDRTTAERIERIAASYHSALSLPLTFAQTSGPVPGSVSLLASGAAPAERSAGRPLMALWCDHRVGESSTEAVRRWLWQFHASLASGLTGGLVIDQYCTIPGLGPALADPDGDIGIERINAVKRMAARMKRWGPLLDRLDLPPPPAPPGADEALSITPFAKDKRRLLLVFNRSRSEYLRTTVTLEDMICGLPAQRLVEVPGDTDASLGEVTEARRGRLTLSVNIAPGDARLYEVF